MDKEITFAKIVERTAKRDAYLTAARYIEQFGVEFGLETIKEKAASHTQYLNELPVGYEYANQTLVPITESMDGEKVDRAMRGLGDSIIGESEK